MGRPSSVKWLNIKEKSKGIPLLEINYCRWLRGDDALQGVRPRVGSRRRLKPGRRPEDVGTAGYTVAPGSRVRRRSVQFVIPPPPPVPPRTPLAPRPRVYALPIEPTPDDLDDVAQPAGSLRLAQTDRGRADPVDAAYLLRHAGAGHPGHLVGDGHVFHQLDGGGAVVDLFARGSAAAGQFPVSRRRDAGVDPADQSYRGPLGAVPGPAPRGGSRWEDTACWR